MPATYTLIASNTLSSSAASVTFSAIPATYTDLVLRMSTRSDASGTTNLFDGKFNGSTTSIYSNTWLQGLSSSASSTRRSNTSTHIYEYVSVDAGATSNTFSSIEMYIPNYTSSSDKPFSQFGVSENNSATTYVVGANALLARISSAITSILINAPAAANFVSGSSFFLYGIKSS